MKQNPKISNASETIETATEIYTSIDFLYWFLVTVTGNNGSL